MRIMNGIVAALVAGMAWGADTELVSAGTRVFRASGKVTFGAVYAERAVKATLVAALPVRVDVHTGRKPTNVFLGEARLPDTAWSFDVGQGVVSLEVPGGTTALQLRFDDLTDLAPFSAKLPVGLAADGQGAGADLGTMTATVAAEKVQGTLSWTGPAGLYRVRALQGDREALGVALTVPGVSSAEAVLLQPGSVVTLHGEAPGQKLPVDRLECRLVGALTATRRTDKAALPWPRSVVLEGEAFKAEGGGAVSRSTEHGNTHGGGCIYAWGTPGHWLTWDATIPADGAYVLTVLMASQEKDILRALAIDGQPPTGAAVLHFEGTGGWGRSNAAEWQAAQPVDAAGKPVAFALKAGTREVRLSNLLGQHMNLDCLLLTPVP